VIDGLGSACRKVVALGILAIEKAKRILRKSFLAGIAKRIYMALIV
jgi:hypothetical protein